MMALFLQSFLVLGVTAFAQDEAVEVHAKGRIRQHHFHTDAASDSKIGDAGKRQLLRSEDSSASFVEFPSNPLFALNSIKKVMAGGVAEGSCKNFKQTGGRDVSVSCPAPLKMVGCTCRDKEGERSGSCGTKFSNGETCTAYSKLDANMTAYARCCHMDWATNFSIKTSEKSGGANGDGIIASCDEGETLLGCACWPDDAPNNGCKHTQVQENSCLATNYEHHAAGVKAQALCAVIPNSSNWETVALSVHAVDKSTNLSCTKDDLEMVSCSCGSATGNCNGGKVMGNKCECFGPRCFATARCADLPVPPSNCVWGLWGDWSECSVSCGKGARSRVREIAVLAMNGGEPCIGPTEANATCKGEGTTRECNSTRPSTTVVVEGGNTMLIVILVVIILLTAGGGGVAHHHKQQKQAQMGGEMGEEAHGEFGEYGEGEYGGEFGGEGEDVGEEAPAEQWPAEEGS